MKRNFLIVIACLLLACVGEANAQVKLGVKGGLNFSSLKLGDNMYNANNKTGFFFGPMVKISLPIVGLSFDAAALYDQKEADLRYADDVVGGDLNATTRIKQKSIDIPVNIRYGVGLGSLANVFLFAGPQWNINVGDKNFKWNSASSYSLKKSTLSVNVGLGVTLLKHLQGTVNYNIECNKSGEMNYESNSHQDWKGRNHTWQVAIGYWF